MPASPTLTGDELAALLGPTTLRRFLSPVPDVTVATALVNQATFTYPLAQLTVDTTSGTWSSVREGQTVYIGSTSGARDRGTYRVRKAGNSTTLYIEEISSQSPGQLAMDIRAAGIANNDYVTVIQRWDVWSVLPRIDVDTGLITEDFDKSVGTYNTTPPNLVYITVNGRRNHLFTYTTASTLALTATVSVVKWPTSSGSTLTYVWTYPAGWTSVSGSTTATLTATAAPGNYVLRCTVTDSIGGATERIIIVNIHHDTLNPPLLISEQPRSDTRDRTGRRMSFPLYNNRLTSLVDGAMCGYFEVCTWNGVDVPTASCQFVGWIQRHDFSTADSLRDASIELVGPAALLDKLQIVSQVITAVASPASWQECVPSLSTAAFMAWYMLQWRVANLLRLFNLTVFSTAASGQRLPKWQVDKGSALQQIRQLITERGNFGANSEGEFFFVYHPSMVNYDDRDTTVITRDALDSSIYKSLNGSRDLPPRVQQVRGEGLSWDGSAELPTPYYCDAPKAPGQGSSQPKLGAQVVTGQTELDQLTGDAYALQNNPYSSLSIVIQKNRDVYEPAEMAFVEVSLPASLNPTDAALVKNMIPLSVNKRHNADGTSDIELIVEAETHGLPGDYVPVPVGNDNNFGSSSAPEPFDPYVFPALGDFSFPFPPAVFPTVPVTGGPTVVPGKAGIRVDATNNDVYWSPDYTIASPMEYNVTPSTWFTNISMATLDRGTPFSRRAYVIGDDGTNSRVAYTEDIFQTAPVWTLGATITGVYDMIESTKGKPGEITIKGSLFTPGGCADDWMITFGTEVSRTGNTITANSAFGSGSHRVHLTVTASSIGAGGPNPPLSIYSREVGFSPVVATTLGWMPDGATYPGGFVTGLLGSACVWHVELLRGSSFTTTLTLTDSGSCGDCVDTTAVSTATSDDYGATFNTPVTLTTTATDTGMSVGDLGVSIIVGDTAKAVITNDHDGVGYRDANNGEATATYPIALLIPDYRIGSTSLSNKGINPNYLMAFPALVSSNSLVKITGVGRADISPSVSGTKALGVSPFGLGAWRGKRLLAIGVVSGTRYIFYSKNTGATWAKTTHANAVSVRPLRYSSTGMHWLAACGADGLLYSNTGGASWVTVSVAGVASYAELLG